MVHKKGLNVTTYTGYTLEQLLEMKNPNVQHLLTQTDILIDGKFDIAQKDLSLSFRGSRNQRIIDVKQSLEQGTVVFSKRILMFPDITYQYKYKNEKDSTKCAVLFYFHENISIYFILACFLSKTQMKMFQLYLLLYLL